MAMHHHCRENIHPSSHHQDDDAPDVDAAAAADRQFVMDRCFAPLKWMLEQGYNQNHEPDEQGNHPYEQPTDAMVKECMEQWGTQELQHFLLSMVNHFLMVCVCVVVCAWWWLCTQCICM